jgi:hypothetical protein
MVIDGNRYPEDSWDLDWDNYIYCLAYDAFQDFKKSSLKQTKFRMLINKNFKNFIQYVGSIYQTNLKVIKHKINITLHVDLGYHSSINIDVNSLFLMKASLWNF